MPERGVGGLVSTGGEDAREPVARLVGVVGMAPRVSRCAGQEVDEVAVGHVAEIRGGVDVDEAGNLIEAPLVGARVRVACCRAAQDDVPGGATVGGGSHACVLEVTLGKGLEVPALGRVRRGHEESRHILARKEDGGRLAVRWP